MRDAAFAVVFSLLSAAAAQAPSGTRPALTGHACDLSLNVVDPDPRGLNVRAAPGKPAGEVIAVLAPVGDWIDVHVVGQSGDWLRIDLAEAIDDDAPGGARELFRGQGWVHVSTVGISELLVGEGTVLRAGPDDSAAELGRITRPEDEPKSTRVLGCRADWLEVEADGLRAYTRTWCTNQRTTCS